MKAQETLELFFNKLKEKDVKYSDVFPLLTKTQQNEAEFIGKLPVHAHLSGLQSIVKAVKRISAKEKPGNNNMVQDFGIVFHGEVKVKYSCRLVKEIDVRKPSEEGTWGVNVSSFKLKKA